MSKTSHLVRGDLRTFMPGQDILSVAVKGLNTGTCE
jgi:hypothetical protein